MPKGFHEKNFTALFRQQDVICQDSAIEEQMKKEQASVEAQARRERYAQIANITSILKRTAVNFFSTISPKLDAIPSPLLKPDKPTNACLLLTAVLPLTLKSIECTPFHPRLSKRSYHIETRDNLRIMELERKDQNPGSHIRLSSPLAPRHKSLEAEGTKKAFSMDICAISASTFNLNAKRKENQIFAITFKDLDKELTAGQSHVGSLLIVR